MKLFRTPSFVILVLGILSVQVCWGDEPVERPEDTLESPVKQTEEIEEKDNSEMENDIKDNISDDLENSSKVENDPSKGRDENTSTDEASKVQKEDKDGASDEEDQADESYGEGSVCVYCQYCKFCKLCDKDCPCKKSKKKPNCHMCKYCKYCYLCSNVCDNFCKPGSFLDTLSSAFWSALPKFDNKMKGEVEKDIDSVKDWIKSYL